MNSYIRTSTGVSLVVNNRPYTIEKTHPNYWSVLNAIRDDEWHKVPDLINLTQVVQAYVKATLPDTSDLRVDLASGTVTFRGNALPTVMVQHILDMAADKFDIVPMSNFLSNLYANPSNRAVTELYGWMEKNGITITGDGYMLVYKRVRDDYKSFHDGSTENNIGEYVSMSRNKVDDDSTRTCSHGLHFCSQSYLPSYSGGRGRVLLLKLDPADVVAIPTDYNSAKGRACRYLVLDELKDDARVEVEIRDVMPQPVVVATDDINRSSVYKCGYAAGYKDGRGKKANGTSYDPNYTINATGCSEGEKFNYNEGYQAGRKDGRDKKPNLFGSGTAGYAVPEPIAPTDPILTRVIRVIADQIGVDTSSIPLNGTIGSLGTDSLDVVEITLALEDEFSIEYHDDDLERCKNVADLVNLTRDLSHS